MKHQLTDLQVIFQVGKYSISVVQKQFRRSGLTAVSSHSERYGDLSPTDKEDAPYGRVELSFHIEAGTCQY